ncbi:MAG: hypothetical protein QOI35_3707, partial [Cryptosporangiaceae bacterium]|nr:hypothetical protein [Cryptosporangiaceae bacterium]
QATATAQTALAKDSAALAKLLSSAAKASGGTSTGSASSGGKSSGGSTTSTGGAASAGGAAAGGGAASTASTGRSGSQSSSQGGSQSPAARVASAQAAVTAAQIGVGKAEDNLTAATLTAPMAGTVASVGLVAGSAAGSNSIAILAPGAAEITVDVPLANMPKIKMGMDADVVADGATAPAAGTVTSIGLLPAASSTGTGSGRTGSAAASTATTSAVAYPVVVLVPEAGGAFVTGSQASVSLEEGTAEDVLTIPSSAVTRTATGTASVTVLSGGQPARRTVKTGLSGTTSTEITAGLKAGEQVVLADLTAALPANSSTSRNRFGGAGQTGRQGGFTGGGFTGGGFTGGAPGGGRPGG